MNNTASIYEKYFKKLILILLNTKGVHINDVSIHKTTYTLYFYWYNYAYSLEYLGEEETVLLTNISYDSSEELKAPIKNAKLHISEHFCTKEKQHSIELLISNLDKTAIKSSPILLSIQEIVGFKVDTENFVKKLHSEFKNLEDFHGFFSGFNALNSDLFSIESNCKVIYDETTHCYTIQNPLSNKKLDIPLITLDLD